MHPDLAPDVSDFVSRTFDALDRGVRLALVRLSAPRRYDPTLAARALEALVAQLSGYAIGLVGASLATAFTRHGDAPTAATVRAELMRIADARTIGLACPRRDVDRELARPPLLAIDDLDQLLRERLVLARAEAFALALSAVAVVRDRAAARTVLAAPIDDELAPYRFAERIEMGWRATCDALAVGRAPTAPVAEASPAEREPTENYCWMRIR